MVLPQALPLITAESCDYLPLVLLLVAGDPGV